MRANRSYGVATFWEFLYVWNQFQFKHGWFRTRNWIRIPDLPSLRLENIGIQKSELRKLWSAQKL